MRSGRDFESESRLRWSVCTTPTRSACLSGTIWIVDYGSYTHGEYLTRTEAVATARAAAEAEGRTVAVDKLGTWIVPEGA